MSKKIAIIDTGAANLHSVEKAFKFIGANVSVTRNESEIKSSDAVVFPGVGAFGEVMSCIEKNNLSEIVVSVAKSDKPFFGICVGLQVLFNDSEESDGCKGLGILKGQVVKFKKAKVVPHIGWSDVVGQCFNADLKGKYYFVHSFYVEPEDRSIISAESEYDGEKFVAAIQKDNIFATQFHPEKSGDLGLELLKAFVGNI